MTSQITTLYSFTPIKSANLAKLRIQFRDHSSCNVNSFLSKLSLVDWLNVLVGDVDENVVKFNSAVDVLYCKCFPLKSKILSTKRLHKPWLTKGILKSIHTKSKYFNMAKLGVIDNDINKAYKNRLTATIKSARKQYYNNAFINNRNNTRKTWSLINNMIGKNLNSKSIKSLLVDGVETSDAEEFNNYFTNIATVLDSNIPPSNLSPLSNMSVNMHNYFYVRPVSRNLKSLLT